MKIFEEYLNRGKEESNFYCEVILKYSYITEEIKHLIEQIDKSHKQCFSNKYKTYKLEESNNTQFKTIEE